MDLRDQLQATLGAAYTIERELGGGGMSRVFLAEETRLARKVVVKVLAPELAAGINADRFEREIRVAASLQQANIVPLLTAGDMNGLPYFTMPFVEGQSLRARLASGPVPSVQESVSILRDVARALGYAHEHGVIHRDIKPDNVLLSRGAAVVTDFGIAKAIDAARTKGEQETLTLLGTSVGTPAYMSPEQAAGDPNLDHRADIYAVGVLAYEMLGGHVPFSGTPQSVMAAHMTTAPPALIRADLPPTLQWTVMKCLAKDPAQRYQTADELLADIDAVSTPTGALPSSPSPRSSTRMLTYAAAAAGLVALVWFGTAGVRRERWARSEAIPQIKRYVDVAQYDSAWMLARRVRDASPSDTTLASLWPRFSRRAVLHSDPEGAQIYRASMNDTANWILLGTTPTDTLLLPTQVGRVRVEKAGFRTQHGLSSGGSRTFLLDRADSPDSGLVQIPGGTFGAFLVGLEGLPAVKLDDYRLGRHEVTNREFKTFVDAGGYTKRDYWPAELTSATSGLTWESAVSHFKDKTGRAGPATWEGGQFPSGHGDFPVGGLSWYEAAAFSTFAGKSLPTIFHWARAATTQFAQFIVPGSNLEGPGPAKASTWRGMSGYGLYDMAGNVREWTANDAGGGYRFILGGGWSDPAYGFVDGYAQRAMDRSAINGVRLAQYAKDDPGVAKAMLPQPRAFRDYAKEKPVPTAVYESFRHIFDYDRGPLHAKLDSRDTTQEDWILERVSFDAAYGNERMMAMVYLPKHGTPPYQPVVLFPGSGVINLASSNPQNDHRSLFIPKAGRALIFPILKSTFERRDSLHSDLPDSTIFWRDHVVMWVKDISRSIDYASTRSDMDSTRVAYLGISWGGNMGGIVPAVEPRIKTVVLYVAGLTMERGRPEVDPLNYLPHIKTPVLMLNGKYDFYFPTETAQKPFFHWLGTAPEHKKYMVYDGGHDVPRTELIAQTLAWLDKYLGPVK